MIWAQRRQQLAFLTKAVHFGPNNIGLGVLMLTFKNTVWRLINVLSRKTRLCPVLQDRTVCLVLQDDSCQTNVKKYDLGHEMGRRGSILADTLSQ